MMTWKSVTDEEVKIAQQVCLWIETVRKDGRHPSDWLPSFPDIYKSALFERIRNGLEPLPYPPPVGLACPWYALVEDVGPHRVATTENVWHDIIFGRAGDLMLSENEVRIVQNTYTIVERHADQDWYIIKDNTHDTPYRFRLWIDDGWWVMQNVEFYK